MGRIPRAEALAARPRTSHTGGRGPGRGNSGMMAKRAAGRLPHRSVAVAAQEPIAGRLMAEPQTSRFWQACLQSGLLDAASLAACWEGIAPEKREVAEHLDRRLARQA